MQEPDTTSMIDNTLGALFGVAPTRLHSPDAVKEALLGGRGPLVAKLPWRQQEGALAFDMHDLSLTAWEDGRVRFLNSLPHDGATGLELGGPGEGPMRRLEALGEESMDEKTFSALMALGGVVFDVGV